MAPGCSGTNFLLLMGYATLALPYMYRAVDTGLRAIDIGTLTEAAQSLGAGWVTIFGRVILPNVFVDADHVKFFPSSTGLVDAARYRAFNAPPERRGTKRCARRTTLPPVQRSKMSRLVSEATSHSRIGRFWTELDRIWRKGGGAPPSRATSLVLWASP